MSWLIAKLMGLTIVYKKPFRKLIKTLSAS